ncbi:TetR/AcrR family transcriptional regulator [bacterium]|nr:TetR/AcrR family transcriptional regulator [bacterium]
MTTHERIVSAALRLIGERGMAGATMSSVAEEAGVSRQTVYNHFPDVDAMVVAAVTRHEGETAAHIAQVMKSASDPTTRLELMIRHGLAVAGHQGTLSLAGISPEAKAELDRHRIDHVEAIAGVLGDGMVTGVFRDDLDIMATAELVQRLIVGGTGSNDPVLADAAVHLVTKGVLTQRP